MFDVAIYGSGFAGYTLAVSLLERGRSVVVVERGPAADVRSAVALSRIQSVWEPVESGGFDFGVEGLEADSRVPRYQGLGGTSALWSGKWRPLDRADFGRSMSGRAWPFSRAELEPHYQNVARRFGLSFEDPPPIEAVRQRAAASGIRLVRIALPRNHLRLRPAWEALQRTSGVRILTDARETAFDVSGGRIVSARWRSHGTEAWILLEAGAHVVAAGGIASAVLVARLSGLSSGEGGGLMGGYVDHPKGDVGVLSPRRNLADLEAMLAGDRFDALYALALPDDEVLSEGIGNHSLFLWGPPSEQRRRPIRRQRVQVVLNAEQFPEAPNGVLIPLGDAVRWRVSGETRRDISRFLSRLLPRIESHFGPVATPRWLTLRGASHPACCTPFSATPRPGQLHPDGRIEGLSNAFCVSSSAFPFAGSANPTFTVAALGARLGERLAGP